MIPTCNTNLTGKGNAMAASHDDAEPITASDGARIDYADQALDDLIGGHDTAKAAALYEFLRETLVDELLIAARTRSGPYDIQTDARALLAKAAEEWIGGVDAETIAGGR